MLINFAAKPGFVAATMGCLAASLQPHIAGAQPVFIEQVIESNAAGGQRVTTADVDGDGDLDVLATAYAADLVAWYENLGGSPIQFTAWELSRDPDGIENNGNEGYADGPRVLIGADIDHDGDTDLLAVSSINDLVIWWENDDNQFTPVNITAEADSAVDVVAADMDGDGDLDILAAAEAANTISWWENDGAIEPVFTEHVITDTVNNVFSIVATDIDRDGDLDVLSASYSTGRVDWWENTGSAGSFLQHQIADDAGRAITVATADIDGDGEIDLLSGTEPNSTIAWYQSDGARPPATPTFQRRTVRVGVPGPVAVAAADVDRDGDIDLLSATLTEDTISWFENLGGGENFTEHVVSATADGAHGVHAADLDGDGDIDIIAATVDGGRIVWYEQVDRCPGDFNGDGILDVRDVLAFLNAWTAGCP